MVAPVLRAAGRRSPFLHFPPFCLRAQITRNAFPLLVLSPRLLREERSQGSRLALQNAAKHKRIPSRKAVAVVVGIH